LYQLLCGTNAKGCNSTTDKWRRHKKIYLNLIKLKIMKKNMGNLDRSLRLIGAAVLILLYFLNVISGTLAIVSLVIATILIITSFISFCPLYLPFKINTCPKEKK